MKLRVFLFILLIGGLFYYFKMYKKNVPDLPNKNILGEETKRQSNDSTIQEKAKELIQNTTNVLSTTSSQIASNTARFLFKNTIDGIITQVDKLPQQDKEIIKDKLCK